MTKLILIRHGQPDAAAELCLGQSNPRLSLAGQGQMRQLRANWRGRRPDRLLVSDLERAVQSAEVLGRGWGLVPQVDERLRELDFGSWQGRSWAEIERDDAAALRYWSEDWVRRAVPGGESFEMLAARTRSWLDEWIDAARERETIAVVAHAGPIRALLCHVLGLPLGHAFRLAVDHARASQMRFFDGQLELSYCNSTLVPAP